MNPTMSCLACWDECHTRTLLKTKGHNSRPANCFSRCLSSSKGREKWNGVITLSEATLFHHTGHLHRLEAVAWPLNTLQPTSITLPWWSELVLYVSSHYTCDAETGLMTGLNAVLCFPGAESPVYKHTLTYVNAPTRENWKKFLLPPIKKIIKKINERSPLHHCS